MSLHHHKWDPQVGDHSTLAPFALIMQRSTWTHLATLAEQLAAETLAAESELLQRPDLWLTLAFPSPLRRLLRHNTPATLTPTAARSMRFDFHLTTTGWQISELNSDVPGGYTEAWNLPRLIVQHLPDNLTPAGNPAAAYTHAIAKSANGKPVALLCAPGYMEDRQLITHLAAQLREQGTSACIADLRQLHWHHGHASLLLNNTLTPLGAIVRFYQSEWLAQLPRRHNWQPLFLHGKTPVTNPPAAALTESKAFPLIWPSLHTKLPTWQRLLPETRPARQTPWPNNPDWLLKGAYSNNGDEVLFPELASPKTLRHLRRELFFTPHRWIAQRRFTPLPIDTPLGPAFPCIGIYIIEGQAAGIYARLSPNPLIDFAATEVAVLLHEDDQP
jgi:glutathionylspermidine synthase